jgi:response regulator RpfG family c-di-GMP phosphodiesterase
VLVLGVDAGLVFEVCDALRRRGISCIASCSKYQTALLVENRSFPVVVADAETPLGSALSLLGDGRICTDTSRAILLGAGDIASLACAVALGAYDYFPKPPPMDELCESVRLGLAAAPGKLLLKAAETIARQPAPRDAATGGLQALIQTVEAKNPFTRRHGQQVAHYAVALARQVQLSNDEVQTIRTAALLHDLGMLSVPEDVLLKPGRLAPQEFDIIRRHPALGASVLEAIPGFALETPLVRHHHENYDGSGYPDALAADRIPLGARIIRLADSLDAMMMRRAHRGGCSPQQAMEEVHRCAGSQFDPQLAAAMHAVCERNAGELMLAAQPPAGPMAWN